MEKNVGCVGSVSSREEKRVYEQRTGKKKKGDHTLLYPPCVTLIRGVRLLNEGENLRAVGYVRVSTEDQAREGYSVSAQERSIRDYCRAKGWKLVRVYRDEGLSAYRDVKRPGYEGLMSSMDEWDVVVVWKLNRLHRTMRGFVRDAGKLADARKDLASITESLDTSSAMGKLVYHLLGALSEFESDQTSERVKAAFAEKFESDELAWFSRPPLGYRLEWASEDRGKGRLQIVPAEAEIVRTLFENALKMSTMALVELARKRGYLGKARGNLLQPRYVHILHNPVYAGYVYYDGELRRNRHKPIVDVDLFNAVQRRLHERTTKHARPPLLLGPDRIQAKRILTSGRTSAVYLPQS